MYHNSTGGGWSGDVDMSDPDQQAFIQSDSRVPALILDGVDYSHVYSGCLLESGYNDNVALGGASDFDQAQISLQVKANNAWAECARENGFPSIQDSTASTDEWPVVLLPHTIVEDQVRQLLRDCPVVDAQEADRFIQWLQENPSATSYPDWYLPTPNISFDLPPFADPSSPTPAETAELERLQNLYDLLYADVQTYDANPGATPT